MKKYYKCKCGNDKFFTKPWEMGSTGIIIKMKCDKCGKIYECKNKKLKEIKNDTVCK